MPQPDADAYLDAFMNGFEFVLLAIRGRLAESELEPAERARLEAFLDDYQRICRAYRARTPAAEDDPSALRVHGAIAAELLPVMGN